MRVLFGVMLPFFGTAMGALAVFCISAARHEGLRRGLNGFAAGVMTAASVWSLLLPSIAQAEQFGLPSWLPAVVGFWLGVLLLLLFDSAGRKLLQSREQTRIDHGTRLMILAIVLHNLPEGMAVGAAFAGVLADSPGVTMAGAMALSLGIAIQNLPEGAIISMPLYAAGFSRNRAAYYGILSGVVEPVGAALTLLFAQIMTPVLPFLLSFAAGAMILVVMRELAPELSEHGSKTGMLLFSLGFTLMMTLDVALG